MNPLLLPVALALGAQAQEPSDLGAALALPPAALPLDADPAPGDQAWRAVPQAALGASSSVVVMFGSFWALFGSGQFDDWPDMAPAFSIVTATAVPLAAAGVVHGFAPRWRQNTPTWWRTLGGAALGSVLPVGLLLASGEVFDDDRELFVQLQEAGLATAIFLPTTGAMIGSWTGPVQVQAGILPTQGGGMLVLTGAF